MNCRRGLGFKLPRRCHDPSSSLILHPRGWRESSQFHLYLKLSSRRGYLAPLKCKKTFKQPAPGLCPGPTGKVYSAPPDPITGGRGWLLPPQELHPAPAFQASSFDISGLTADPKFIFHNSNPDFHCSFHRMSNVSA